MKKRVFLFFLILTAAVAATIAFVGCGQTKPARTQNEYAVLDDGLGKKYTLRGGDEITVFYAYDAEKELDFTVTYYDQTTGKETRSTDDYDTRSLSSPQVLTYSFTTLTEGKYEYCYFTLIISAQAVSANLTEHGKTAFDYVEVGVGADYSFIPEMTGIYTVTCTPKDEGDEAEYIISDANGEVVGVDEKLKGGNRYYVHVRVKSGDDSSSVGVTTSVAYTPDELKLGNNAIVIGEGGVIGILPPDGETGPELGEIPVDRNAGKYAFIPEEGGVYSFTDDTGADAYEVLDGETYERITPSQWENEVVLEAGKKYLIHGQVGYAIPINATLTVKRVDRPLEEDVETQLRWNEFCVFTAKEKTNYHFKAELQTGYKANAAFIVYDYYGWKEYENRFDDEGEFDLVLDKGAHYLRVDYDCAITCTAAPKTLDLANAVRVKSEERVSFTAPYNCKYNFTLYGEGGELKVLDKDGNDVKGEKLTAGGEYIVYADFDGYDALRFIEVEPIAEGEFTHNQTYENVSEDTLYSFTAEFSGTYRFIGASELTVFFYSPFDYTPVETDGDTVRLTYERTYFIAVKAETLTYGKTVTVRYYPPEIPTDGVTQILAYGVRRFDLPFDDEVTINLRHSGTRTYKLYDGDLEEIQTGEFVNESEAVNRLTLNLTAGTYYLSLSNSAKAWFDEPPLGCGGIYTVTKDCEYYGLNAEGYRYACGLGMKEFTVTFFNRNVLNYNALNDVMKVYYNDDGTETSLKVKGINYDGFNTTITFKAEENVGEYFIRFKPDHYGYEFSVGGATSA